MTTGSLHSHYDMIAQVIAYIDRHHTAQPDLATLAGGVGLSPSHLQRLFTDWAGISPKKFLDVLNASHLRRCLQNNLNLAEAADALGLAEATRVYDLAMRLEAVPPAVIRSGGQGLTLRYGMAATPFGQCLLAIGPHGITDLHFVDDFAPVPVPDVLFERWPNAWFDHQPAVVQDTVRQIFTHPDPPAGRLKLWIKGTAFQIKVWEALLRIPPGQVTTYQAIGLALAQPNAAQAVGQAVGANPVAYLIPCHRVIRSTGVLANYRWGAVRKKALLGYELGRLPAPITGHRGQGDLFSASKP